LIVAVTKRRRLGGVWCRALAGVLLVLAAGLSAAGAELKEAGEKFLTGDYAGCIALARQMVRDTPKDEDVHLLLTRALLATGQYAEARAAITNAMAQDVWSIRLRWLAREVFLANGQVEAAAEIPDEILGMVSRHIRDFNTDPPSLIVFGQAALLKGADPKRVLDTVFERAKRADPKLRDVYLASGGLALEKHDFALAAKRFEEGLKELPDDPDLHYGLAQAYAPSDAALMAASLEAALERNSNHVGSLLLLADHTIDAEDYVQAGKLLDQVKVVNPSEPEAWAYRAVLAQLQNQPQEEQTARQNALKFWPTNPRVDYLIGLKLSQNYRFTEGAAHQRQALKFDSDYLPAKAQLAQDLLRLGEEAEGWTLAEAVQKEDGYDVEAYNLTTLHDTMHKYVALTNQDFLLRMSRREADLYGSQVLDLLSQARSNLCAKYGIEVKRPTIVEVFAEQKDFAVRTFGMPGNPGYLGVCFGTLITANSPAAHVAHVVNWQAVLYHEFCHVVTLQLTRNKMPRWLSEGISVYEESQANPSWGQRMNPGYREMVLGDELTPVSKLSGAFLSPESDLHLQFAYYESSLVVEFIVKQFGVDNLKAILRDLGEGGEINETIEKHTAPMAKLEEDFAAFARQRAEQLAPGLDWERPDQENGPPSRKELLATARVPHERSRTNAPEVFVPQHPPGVPKDPEEQAKWISSHPTNYYALTEQGTELLSQKKFEQAKAPLEKLIELYPSQTGLDSAYAMLASVHRSLGETNAERQVLARFAEQDDEALDAYQRLMELADAAQDWPAMLQNARRYLAVNPLVATPYRFLARASEQTGDSPAAIQAYRALLQLNPLDPAELHFRLAKLLHHVGNPEARRQVLQALEEAPRYREALRLLLEIDAQSPQTKASTTETAEVQR
jgi:tetratricopeptide (TPR) repeat protein